MLDIREHQLLMLLFVMKTDLQQRREHFCQLRIRVRKQSSHVQINMTAIGVDLDQPSVERAAPDFAGSVRSPIAL